MRTWCLVKFLRTFGKKRTLFLKIEDMQILSLSTPFFVVFRTLMRIVRCIEWWYWAGPSTIRESNLQILLVGARSHLSSLFTISRGYILRTYLSPGGSIRSPPPPPPGSLRGSLYDKNRKSIMCSSGTDPQSQVLAV